METFLIFWYMAHLVRERRLVLCVFCENCTGLVWRSFVLSKASSQLPPTKSWRLPQYQAITTSRWTQGRDISCSKILGWKFKAKKGLSRIHDVDSYCYIFKKFVKGKISIFMSLRHIGGIRVLLKKSVKQLADIVIMEVLVEINVVAMLVEFNVVAILIRN